MVKTLTKGVDVKTVTKDKIESLFTGLFLPIRYLYSLNIIIHLNIIIAIIDVSF